MGGFPGNRPELIAPNRAKDYKVHRARFQQENDKCNAGQRLGEVQIAVTVQKFIAENGQDDDDNDHGPKTVPLLRVKVENREQDCGADIDKGFYFRVQHTGNPASDAPQGDKKGKKDQKQPAKKCEKRVGEEGGPDKWDHTFEFTGRKALPKGSTGSFDVLLTSLDMGNEKQFRW